MTIQDYGSIGELIAAIATVATLAYLAIQIRHNTAVGRATGTAAVTSAYIEFSLLLSQDAELARVYFSGLADPEALKADEYARFDLAMGAYVQVTLQAYYLHQEGALSEVILSRESRHPFGGSILRMGVENDQATSKEIHGRVQGRDREAHPDERAHRRFCGSGAEHRGHGRSPLGEAGGSFGIDEYAGR